MTARKKETPPVLRSNVQVSFYYRLQELRDLYMYDAMKRTVEKIDRKLVDQELSQFATGRHLRKAASFGLRGELFFPVPCIIEANPFLLGYYRLLFGLSQNEFYGRGPFGPFKRLEDSGELPDKLRRHIPGLCMSLARTAEELVDGIDDLSLGALHDLQLLTLGPQLRASENTKLGQDAARELFDIICRIIRPYVKETTHRTILLENDSWRTVIIEFFGDPDICITEKLPSGVRPLLAMKIEEETDTADIPHHLRKAEKSHRKARNRGFSEFWTFVRADVSPEVASRESPTTGHFFRMDRICDPESAEHREFKSLLGSLMGIRIST